MKNIICTNVKHGEPIRFTKPFTGDKIACTAVHRLVGYWNLGSDAMIYTITGTSIAKIISFEAGFYTIEDIISRIKKDINILSIESIKIKKDGRVELKIKPNTVMQVRLLQISEYLVNILKLEGQQTAFIRGMGNVIGFKEGKTYTSIEPCRPYPNSINIYLDQLIRDDNLLDGSISNLLCIIPITDEEKKTDHCKSIQFINPDYKKLIGNSIHELVFRIEDEMGHPIDNRGKLFTIMLQIL